MAFPTDFEALTAFLQTPWGTAVLLPIGYGVCRFIEYAIKRKLEGKPESERLDQYHKLVDLQEKLNKTGKTMADLDALRTHAFGDVADNAIQIAQTFTTRAQKLVSDYEEISKRHKSPHEVHSDELSQAELN
ncbi:hypothetical protein [Pseudomonas kitaguniensis]|uniref:hypothetical protein n=1 Tax=Pseudomonas kitaguniensis TaxID=2607908 RepID=UPI003D015D8A